MQGLLDVFLKQAAPSRTPAGGLPEDAQRSVEHAKRYEKAMRAVLSPVSTRWHMSFPSDSSPHTLLTMSMSPTTV